MTKTRRERKKRTTTFTPQPLVEEAGTSEFQEYQYMIADLKRVAILAGAIFAVLIALSFFI